MTKDFNYFFNSEIKEKKQGIYGNRAKTSRSGKSKSRSKMLTSFDFMTAREKRKLNGEVKVTNMYETIIDRDEFLLKEKDIQKAMLTRWRELYDNDKIMKDMGIGGKAYFFNLLKDLEIPKKTRGGRRRAKAEQKEKAPVMEASKPSIQDNNSNTNDEVQQPTKIITNGLHLEYNGIYDHEQLTKIFTKLQLLTEAEENKFYLSISLSERQD